MITTYTNYEKEKKDFFKKHGNEFDTYTSALDEYDSYFKEYIFRDNAIWYEAMRPTYESVEVEIKKCKINIEVKMLRTEFWSTESQSKFYYEKY